MQLLSLRSQVVLIVPSVRGQSALRGCALPRSPAERAAGTCWAADVPHYIVCCLTDTVQALFTPAGSHPQPSTPTS